MLGVTQLRLSNLASKYALFDLCMSSRVMLECLLPRSMLLMQNMPQMATLNAPTPVMDSLGPWCSFYALLNAARV